MRSRFLIAIGLSATLLAACNPGSGNVVTETREVADFEAIAIGSALTVRLEVKPGAKTEVVVNYDDNLIDRVITEVSGGILTIDVDGSMSTFGGGRYVSVVVDSLESLEISGASNLDGVGEIDSYRLLASGAADVDLRDVIASDISIEISGSSDVSIHASNSVAGEVSGASDVTIYGDPSNVRVDTGGTSDLELKD